MAFIRLQRDSFERSAVTLRPRIHFISSSAGVTGSEYVSPVRSKCIKEIKVIPAAQEIIEESGFDAHNSNPAYDASDLAVLVTNNIAAAFSKALGSSDIYSLMDRYLKAVNDAPQELRYTKTVDIHRVDPSFKFEPPGGLNLMIKNNIRNVMMPHYKYKYRDCGFYYKNYNTVNFFTASNLPESAVIMYPDSNNNYVPDGSFSTSFWINPRYKSESNRPFKAGTLLHLSSSICISLISGSSKDVTEKVDSFKILVQLSQSADTPPSQIDFNNLTYPNDLVFTSSNELKWNNWHSVVFNWGANIYNDFTSSLLVDNIKTNFVIPSSSIGTKTLNVDGNSALFVGNYYEGTANNISKFFNSKIAVNEGVEQLDSGNSDPSSSEYNFRHPLNAEFHELKIMSRHMSGSEIEDKRYTNEKSLKDLLFYLPPFFYPKTTERDVIQTPFQKFRTGSNDPFNVSFSFGVGGKEINADNFVRDFKLDKQPRLFFMTASTIDTTVQNISADQYVYASGSIIKRNFLLLPNDNGQFFPDYSTLETKVILEQLESSFSTTGEGVDYSRISLENLIPESTLFPGLIAEGAQKSNSPLAEIMGASPENPGVVPGSVLTMAQRTRDLSSNEIVMLNISNLYYGNRIIPGSIEFYDNHVTGSRGRVQIKLKDDGIGGLYRADCLTEQANWATLGNVFYDEGVAIVKTPHLLYYMKDRSDISFTGEHNVHTLTINVPVERSILNTSVNPTFKSLPPTTNLNDSDLESIQLSSVNIHDENFNIIMKANFAQPITKTRDDEFVVRLKEDF